MGSFCPLRKLARSLVVRDNRIQQTFAPHSSEATSLVSIEQYASEKPSEQLDRDFFSLESIGIDSAELSKKDSVN